MAGKNLLNLEKVSKSFVSRMLLDDVTVGIDEGDKIGVLGINGAGKSTLLGVISGTLEADEGRVTRGGDVRISYLVQNPEFDNEKSILENVAAMVSGKEEHWDTNGEVRSMLLKYEIPDPDASPRYLSGGQKKRAALVAALLTPADLLILDEPTNHLDGEMCSELEEYLRSFRGAVLLVTHDRYFLDQVTNEILELDRGKVYRYEGNYSKYLEMKAGRMEFALAAERKAAALYKKDLAWMMRGARARSTKQKAHIQRFEALRDRDKIVEERQVELSSLSSRLGGRTIEADGLGKGFDGKTLFENYTYHFLKTDRIGIIGPNGCRKSTLLRCLTGKIEADSGTLTIGQTVKIGFFSQESEELDESLRVIDFIKDTAPYVRTKDGLVSASSMCERFLFDSELQYAPIEKLSGGERRRLCLLRVLMEAPNVLVFDEPTNDLDIQTLRILEDYLDTFAGIVIAVSHDRYFLDRVVTRIFSFEPDGTIRQSEGGYAEYLEHRGQYAGSDIGISGAAVSCAGCGGGAAIQGTAGQNSGGKSPAASGMTKKRRNAAGPVSGPNGKKAKYTPQHEKKEKLTFLEQKEYEGIESEIDALEEKSAELEDAMLGCVSDYVRLAELSAEKEQVDARLEERMERYIELQDKVDRIAEQR